MTSTLAPWILLACALMGVWWGDRTVPSASGWLAASAIALTLVAVTWRLGRGTYLTALGTAFILFTARTVCVAPPAQPSSAALVAPAALWRTVVDSTPQVAWYGERARVDVAVWLVARAEDGRWLPEQGRVRLLLHDGPTVTRGDTLLVRLVVRPPRDTAAPWQLSPEDRARRHKLSAQAETCGLHAVLHHAGGLRAYSDRARVTAAGRLSALLGPQVAGIAAALALGDTRAIPSEQRDRWADAGMAHLLAVSGLHVGLVARGMVGLSWALLALCGPLADRVSLRRLSAACALVTVWLYALFTGGSTSALRAAWMASLALGGRVVGQPHRGAAYPLAIAGLVILAIDPLAAAGQGFWLSFVSVAALLALPPWPKSEAATSWVQRLGSGLRRVLYALATGLAASVATAPLCALFFGRVSLIAPWANLLAVPWGGAVCTPLALGAAALSTLWGHEHPAARALGCVARMALQALDGWATWMAQVPHAALAVGPRGGQVLISLAALGSMLWGMRFVRAQCPGWLWGRRGQAVGLLFALSLGPMLGPWVWRYELRGQLRVYHLDVGQGDCTLIGLPDDTWVLIDGGGASYPGQRDPGRTAVAPALRALGVLRFRAVLLTHPHPDHQNGLAHVLQQVPTEIFWRNEDAAQDRQTKVLEALVRARGGTVSLPPARVYWGPGLTAEFYQPLRARPASCNDHSIVTRLDYGARSLLLMGDAEAAAEWDLRDLIGPAELLKVGHHGSRTSTTQALIERVRPRAAVVSCGLNNRFGHPHAVTLERLRGNDITVLRTDLLGTLTFTTKNDGPWLFRSALTRQAFVALEAVFGGTTEMGAREPSVR